MYLNSAQNIEQLKASRLELKPLSLLGRALGKSRLNSNAFVIIFEDENEKPCSLIPKHAHGTLRNAETVRRELRTSLFGVGFLSYYTVQFECIYVLGSGRTVALELSL